MNTPLRQIARITFGAATLRKSAFKRPGRSKGQGIAVYRVERKSERRGKGLQTWLDEEQKKQKKDSTNNRGGDGAESDSFFDEEFSLAAPSILPSSVPPFTLFFFVWKVLTEGCALVAFCSRSQLSLAELHIRAKLLSPRRTVK